MEPFPLQCRLKKMVYLLQHLGFKRSSESVYGGSYEEKIKGDGFIHLGCSNFKCL
jgi:hypothetical protein